MSQQLTSHPLQHNENQEAEDDRNNTEAWDIAGDVDTDQFNRPYWQTR